MAALSSIYEEGVTVNRQDIQEAIAKSVELRALHAALIQGNTPSHVKFLTSASSPRPASHFSAHDYPIFTPSYVEEPFQGFAHQQTASQTIHESWEGNQIDLGDNNLQLVNYAGPNESSRKQRLAGLVTIDNHIYPEDDTKSVSSWCTYQKPFLQNSPGTETLKSRRRNSLEDFKSVSSCNDSKPAAAVITNNDLSNNIAAQVTESHATLNQSQSKSRGTILSRLIPRLKRRQKNGNSSPIITESEVSHVHKDFEIVSVETLKKELVKANQERDLAVAELLEMKSSFGELSKKLKILESHCQKLKMALQQADQTNSLSKEESLMPVSEEVMTKGFLEFVSEARFSVKQFCKILIEQIDETDAQLTENLSTLLNPYRLSLSSKYSKVVLYHLEAIVNQAFYQDFENCAFQQNGTPKLLDPQQFRKTQFLTFSALRNVRWNEVLKKGTKHYSEEFSEFCDQKMRCIIMTLNWTRSWSEILLQPFFVAAKCTWLLHLLAFSFSRPVTILRVEEDRCFDPHYMEDMFADKQKAQNPSRVKLLVTPGFYVRDKILRCKVLCRYKTLA